MLLGIVRESFTAKFDLTILTTKVVIDFIHSILGEYASSHTHTQIQRPNQIIINKETGTTRATTSDVPDLVSVHGTLTPSHYISDNATLTVNFGTGPPFPGTTPFIWTITGTTGRMRVTSERGPFIQSEASAFPIPIEVEDFATGEVRKVAWDFESWQVPLLARGRNIAKMYDLYYEGRAEKYGLADFEGAVVRHRQLDEMLY